MRALLDADILVYRVGFTTQEEDLEIAKWRMNDLVQRILAETEATSFKCYLTASGDTTAFRKQVYPAYKENRKAPKPVHYQAMREFLVEEYDAEIVSTIEADDALAIEQTAFHNKNDPNASCIVSIDKDLDMITGWHYNFVKASKYYIQPEDGIYNFYKQLLMGDKADNVQGIKGIGEKKADKILAGAEIEQELFDRVRDAYSNDEEMLRTGEVLWIIKEDFPQGLWSLTEYGQQLAQGTGYQFSLLSNPIGSGMESIGEEMSVDGFLANG